MNLLVMATHGLSGIQKTPLRLGDREGPTSGERASPILPKSAEAKPPETVLVALDLGSGPPSIMRHGIWLAEHYGAKLIVA